MSEETKNTVLDGQFEDNANEQLLAVEAVQETTDELIEQESNELPDLDSLSLMDIIKAFEEIVAEGDQQKMYKFADIFKAAFYKNLKKEKIAAGFLQPSEDIVLVNDVQDSEEGDTVVEEVSINPFAEIERGFKNLYSNYKSLRNSHLLELEKDKEKNLVERLKIIEDIRALLETQEDLNTTFPEFRKLQTRWREVGNIPQTRVKDVYDTYHHSCEMFYDFVKINNELRDLDFKKNLEAKMVICEKAEALLNNENIINAFNELQKLHESWKELGPVDRVHRELIWDRFKAATSQINKNHQSYFESIKAEQKTNLEAKMRICEKADEIAQRVISEAGQWNTASKEIEELQKEWKTIGFASKKDNQKIYDTFRQHCDNFFNKKREFYSEFKDQMTQNMDKKIALCEQAELLAQSEDWKKTTDQLISLQKQWKEIGPVSRKKSDMIWSRFRAACDTFFENKEKNHGGVDPEYIQNLEAKLAILEEVKAMGEDQLNADTLKDVYSRWNAIGFVPFKSKDKIADDFKTLISERFEGIKQGFEARPNRKKKTNNANNRKPFAGGRQLSERDKLVQLFRKKESEIQTFENNMGFFASSKNAQALLQEMNAKIDTAKAELKELADKINSLNQ